MADWERQRMRHANEPAHGSDLPGSERPGVPMETTPRPLVPTVHWRDPEPQPPDRRVTRRRELQKLTPVFSTALPPRGISGMLRRAAYRIPETRAQHFLTLMLADRVDVLEHRLARLLKVVTLLPLGTAAAILIVAKLLPRTSIIAARFSGDNAQAQLGYFAAQNVGCSEHFHRRHVADAH